MKKKTKPQKKKPFRPRLPMEAVKALRTKGGPESGKKGKRGYDRNHAKQDFRESL